MGRNLLVEAIVKTPICVWDKTIPDTQLEQFKKRIEKNYKQQFQSYWEIHKWSVDNYPQFWREIWDYFDVIASRSYEQVFMKKGKGFLENEWFSNARFNYAENILRVKDERNALILVDESRLVEKISFLELYDQVKIYASALRKFGLKKGERVSCYMSNRKEAIFAFLATATIGGVWSGPLPFFSAKAASNLIKDLEPKFLFAVDHHVCDGEEYNTIENLPALSLSSPTIEKVVIVATQKQTRTRDLSNIRHSILLEEFLETGRDSAGADIIFEQLPFEHPLCINFTSGTTGASKAVVHSIGSFIPQFRDIALHLDLKNGDVMCNYFPVGWSLWETFVPCLGLGVQLLLFDGYPSNKSYSMWEVFADHDVSFAYVVPNILEKLEKTGMPSNQNLNLANLKFLAVGGYPINKQHIDYVRRVKEDVFIGSWYGSTEAFGAYSGFDLNMVSYGGEIQAPALGVDLRCYDEKGNSVVGQRGEVVITSPTPSFPTHLWKDERNLKLKETYLSRYEGAWTPRDECWINPETKGIIILGRSDDTLNQDGERFTSSDVYLAIQNMEEIEDYVCVSQDLPDGGSRAVLFLKMRRGWTLDQNLKEKVSLQIQQEFMWDFAPKVIQQVPDIPYNLNNKRMESIVRKNFDREKYSCSAKHQESGISTIFSRDTELR